MDAFDPISPNWTIAATHAFNFCCPSCKLSPSSAKQVWVNRRSPVYTENQRKKWQEFYHCECGTAWWGWSNERAPSEFAGRNIGNIDDDMPPDNFFL